MCTDTSLTQFPTGAVRGSDAAGVRFDLVTPKRKAMKRLQKQVFCSQCGTIRICRPDSPYAVCPNGHGRLVPRFTKREAKQAFVASVPRARRVGRNRFTISGHAGLFGYRDGSGRRPARPGMNIGADEVIACHAAKKRRMIRVFARKALRQKSGGDDAS
jgi:hypothetical protein